MVSRSTQDSIRRALVSACLATMFPALLPTSTMAGQYLVKACNDAPAGENHSWSQFTSGAATGRVVLAPQDDAVCSGSGINGGLIARAVVAASRMTTTDGATAGWRFTAPADTSIVGLDYDRWGFRYGTDYSDGIDDSRWSMRATTDSAALFESAVGNIAALPGSPGRAQVGWPVGTTSALTVTVLCRTDFQHGPCENFGVPLGATIGGLDIQQRRVQLNVYGATVALQDDHSPTLGNVGGSLSGGGWHTGATESVSFDADDLGGGVASGSLSVAGATASTLTCDPAGNVALAVPCPLHAPGQAISLDTQALPDGRHTAVLTVSDVAGNKAATAFPINVDRTAPAADLARPTDDYSRTVRFTDVADDLSGLDGASAAAEYSGDGGTTWHSMPGSLVGETYAAHLPDAAPDGQIRVRLHLRDVAGNAAIAGGRDGQEVTVDTTAPIGGDALVLRSDQRASVNGGFQLRWTNPDGQATPLRTVFVQMCDTDEPSRCVTKPFRLGNPADDSLDRLGVPADGTWETRIWLGDAAGNADPEHTSNPVSLTLTAPPPSPPCSDGADNDGDALVDAADPGCLDPVTNRYVPKKDSESRIAVLGAALHGDSLLIACSPSKLVLIDVRRAGDRVQLFGATRREWAGRAVHLYRSWDGRRVATVLVKSDGTFSTLVALPPKAVRSTNRARYQARMGTRRTLDLKLVRRLTISAIRAHAGRRVEIVGRIAAPRDASAPVIVKRMVSCGSYEVVKTFRARADGTFRVIVPAPERARGAVYRVATRVRRYATSPRTSPTFSLPGPVDL